MPLDDDHKTLGQQIIDWIEATCRVSYEYVAKYLRHIFDQHNVMKLAFDRCNMQHLKPWLVNAGLASR